MIAEVRSLIDLPNRAADYLAAHGWTQNTAAVDADQLCRLARSARPGRQLDGLTRATSRTSATVRTPSDLKQGDGQ